MISSSLLKSNSLANRILVPTAIFMVALIAVAAISIFIIFHQYAHIQVKETKHNLEEQMFNILNRSHDKISSSSGSEAVFLHKVNSTAALETFSRDMLVQVRILEKSHPIYEIDNNVLFADRFDREKSFLVKTMSVLFPIEYSGTLYFKP